MGIVKILTNLLPKKQKDIHLVRNLIDLDNPIKYQTIHRTYEEAMAYEKYLDDLCCDKCKGTKKDIHLAPATVIFNINGIRTTIFFTGMEGKYPQEMNLCGDCIEAIVLFSLKHMPRMMQSSISNG